MEWRIYFWVSWEVFQRRSIFHLISPSDIPPDVDSLTISIHNAVQKRSKHTSIGEVVVHFSKLNSGRVVDDWWDTSFQSSLFLSFFHIRYNLIPITNYGVGGVSSIAINSSPVHPQLGSLRIRARYCNELIMPFEEYKLLQKVRMNSSSWILIEFLISAAGHDWYESSVCFSRCLWSGPDFIGFCTSKDFSWEKNGKRRMFVSKI